MEMFLIDKSSFLLSIILKNLQMYFPKWRRVGWRDCSMIKY